MPPTDIFSILDFRHSLRSCTACPLHLVGNGPVPWSGDPHPTYAVLGMNPGKTEDRESRPFVGDSGAILRHWLRQAGFDPSTFAYLNAVSCMSSPRDPTPEETAACRSWMNGQLEIIRPQVLITLGVLAFKQLRGNLRFPDLQTIHGKPYRHPVYNFSVVSTYHPSAYLRGHNSTYEKKITTDLALVRDWYAREQAGELSSSDCYVCGDSFYNWDDWSIPYCYRHSQRQSILFPEDIT